MLNSRMSVLDVRCTHDMGYVTCVCYGKGKRKGRGGEAVKGKGPE